MLRVYCSCPGVSAMMTYRRPRSRPSESAADRGYPDGAGVKGRSKVALPFFQLHRPFLVMVDQTVLALRPPHEFQFLDDRGDRVRLGAHRSAAVSAAQGAHSGRHSLGALIRRAAAGILGNDQLVSAH